MMTRESMRYLMLVLSMAVVQPVSGRADWLADLSARLDALEHATDRATTRALVREATELIEGVPEEAFAGEHEDRDQRRRLLERAASRRVLAAAMALGEQDWAAGDAEAAFAWFRQAATGGYPPAMIQLGLMYSNGDGVERDLEKASSWLRPANVKGSAIGKYLLAECFLYGKGVDRNPPMAVALLRDAANMPNPGRALDLLGTCYNKGWGVIQDSAQAAALYGQACDVGFYNACANLAVLTMTGNGVEQDAAAAVALLRSGVNHENPMCMFFYAAAQLDGLGGLKADEKKAAHWFRKAARAGNKPAAAWCRENDLSWEEP